MKSPELLTPEDLNIIRGRAKAHSIDEIFWLRENFLVSPEFQEYYLDYLRRGFHRDLAFLERTSLKFDPRILFTPIGSIAVVPIFYLNSDVEVLIKNSRFQFSRFAWGEDYHRVIKKLLGEIFSGYEPLRIVVDSTPLPERYFARRAGVGFLGRNSMLIHPKKGSYFFLSFVFLQSTISPEVALENRQELIGDPGKEISHFCKECDLCVRACPGGALDGAGLLDCNRCWSYWSIENRQTEIALSSRTPKGWGNRLYGCDICQEVCPYNRQVGPEPGGGLFLPVRETMEIAQGETPHISRKRGEALGIGRGYRNLGRNRAFLAGSSFGKIDE